LARLESADAERVGVVREILEVIACGSSIYVGNDLPVRIRRAGLFKFKALLAARRRPVQREGAVEIDVTALRISEVARDRLR